jgi:endonuclease/exonuclease/phosphatase family metal-dependent hydrolase
LFVCKVIADVIVRPALLVLCCFCLSGCVRHSGPRMAPLQGPPMLGCHSVESDTRVDLNWIGPIATRDERRRDLWCRAVGPALVSSVDAQPDKAVAVAVVTWNTQVGSGSIRRLVEKLRSGELTGGAAAPEFVLLLQEVRRSGASVPDVPTGFNPPRRLGPELARSTDGTRPSDSNDIAEIARSLGLNLAYAPAMRNGAMREDRGNAILSSLPFDEVTVIELPMERQRRIAIAATLHGLRAGGASRALRVASVHLETRAGLLGDGPAAARQRQARALVEALSSTSMPTVIAGDLNTSQGDDEPAVDELRRGFPDAGPTRGPTWRGPLGLAATLDYLFARIPGTNLKVRRVPERFGSDHHPLIAMIP